MTDPVLETALAQESIVLFGAIKIALPGYDLCLLDGAGQVSFGGNTYLGEDPTFGTINAIETISEEEGDVAPELTLSLYPKDGVALADLASSDMQGSVVQIFVGVVDPATGNVVGQPECVFLGEVDVPTITVAEGRRELEFTIVSVFERLFEVNEGERASDGWHQSIWPGEKGLEHMTGTAGKLYWGAKRPVPTSIGSGGSLWARVAAGEFR